jgi:type VI secretion system protein
MAMTARLLLPLFALLLAGCGTLDALKNLVGLGGPPKTALESVQIVAEAEANHGLPTRLDLVFVYDPTLAALLPKSGPDWFRQKAALLAAWPLKLEALVLEIPPQSEATPTLPKKAGKALTVLLYADYIAPAGQPVANLTPFTGARITLGPESIAIAAAP